MKTYEQFSLFADSIMDTASVEKSTPVRRRSGAQKKTRAIKHDPHAIRTEGTMQLTEYLHEFSEHYYTVRLPKRLFEVFAFPLTEQNFWKATHPSEHFTIETGVCEGCPEKEPEVMTIRDFGYFMALYALIKNTPVPEREVEVTARHIAYVMAGFPKSADFPKIKDPEDLAKKISAKSLIGGKKSKEFGEALNKAYGRHMHYILPQRKGSSAPGTQHWLSLLNYEATKRTLNIADQAGKFYRNFTIGSAFDILAPQEQDYVTFDCRQFFRAGSWMARAVLLKVLPQLQGAAHDSRHRPLEIKASMLLRQIGAASYTYDRPAKMLAALQPVAESLDKLDSIFGTRLRAKIVQKPKQEPIFVIYTEAKAELPAASKPLDNQATYQTWLASGKTEKHFWERLQKGRQDRLYLNDDEQDLLRKLGLEWRPCAHYLRLSKQLLHQRAFAQALADYKIAVQAGKSEATAQALAESIQNAISYL